MKKLLGNAYSLNMLNGRSGTAHFKRLTQAEFVIGCADAESVYGHAQSAPIVASLIGRDVQVNRVSTILEEGDQLYIAQYAGPRLEEGATALPEGAAFTWWCVTVKYD